MEKSELERLAVEEGVPADFDVAQINWKPDYDPFYYQQLLVRAERLYLFRDQYLFLLPSVLVAETPQAGHATYLFSRPENLATSFASIVPRPGKRFSRIATTPRTGWASWAGWFMASKNRAGLTG